MNRIIKFRAWDGNSMSSEFGFSERHTTFDDCKSYRTITQESESWELMQFTGLLDKNGVEIYDGDIVETINMIRYLDRPARSQVEWFDDKAMFQVDNPFINIFDAESIMIIGNIYENPELLKGES